MAGSPAGVVVPVPVLPPALVVVPVVAGVVVPAASAVVVPGVAGVVASGVSVFPGSASVAPSFKFPGSVPGFVVSV